jgi:arginase family enzyme
MSIQRYDLIYASSGDAWEQKEDGGKYVKYEDHLAEMERYKKALEWLFDDTNGMHIHLDLDGQTPLEAIESAMKEEK